MGEKSCGVKRDAGTKTTIHFITNWCWFNDSRTTTNSAVFAAFIELFNAVGHAEDNVLQYLRVERSHQHFLTLLSDWGQSKVTINVSGHEVDLSRRPCATFGSTAFSSRNISMIQIANLKIYLLGST